MLIFVLMSTSWRHKKMKRCISLNQHSIAAQLLIIILRLIHFCELKTLRDLMQRDLASHSPWSELYRMPQQNWEMCRLSPGTSPHLQDWAKDLYEAALGILEQMGWPHATFSTSAEGQWCRAHQMSRLFILELLWFHHAYFTVWVKGASTGKSQIGTGCLH